MKKIITSMILCATAMLNAQAQELPVNINRRLPVENLTEYDVMNTGVNNSRRKIGSTVGAPVPCTGSPKIPVILVQFQDTKFSYSDEADKIKEYYQDFCSKQGFNIGKATGSVLDYFKEQSYGQFTPEFHVIGPVELGHDYRHYGRNEDNKKDVNIDEFFSEACKLAVDQGGVEWENFDNNDDGIVDFVFYIYAGEGENAAELDNPDLIWPKEKVSTSTVTTSKGTITIGAYGCTNETYLGVIDGIGTMCHELSHGLGLPDFYDTGNGDGFDMDIYDVMNNGCYLNNSNTPCAYSAYERDFMGWRSLVTLDINSNYDLTIKPLQKDGVGYKVVCPNNSNEYYILENRQNIGFDKFFGYSYTKYGVNHGLFVTRVTYDSDAWSQNKVNYQNAARMTPVCADGSADKFAGSNDDYMPSLLLDLYPNKNNITEVSSYTFNSGNKLQQRILDIKESDKGIITLQVVKSDGYTEEEITDMTPYTRTSNEFADLITYNRSFSKTTWQALYVPFSISYDEWKEDFDIAYINNFHMYDDDDDGTIDRTELEIISMKSGQTQPNTPYFIKAKTTGQKQLKVYNKTLNAAADMSVECSSTLKTFTFTGTSTGLTNGEMYANSWYGMSNNQLSMASSASVSLPALRWYLKVTDKSGQLLEGNISNNVRLRVSGNLDLEDIIDDEATAITEIVSKPNAEDIYTLDGRKVNGDNLKAGIYIKGNKKFVVR